VDLCAKLRYRVSRILGRDLYGIYTSVLSTSNQSCGLRSAVIDLRNPASRPLGETVWQGIWETEVTFGSSSGKYAFFQLALIKTPTFDALANIGAAGSGG